MNWGLLPVDVKELLKKREWENSSRLRKRFLGQLPFPITVNLKPPTGTQALQDLEHFRQYTQEWKSSSQTEQITWQSKKFRQLGKVDIPTHLKINSIESLIEFLGNGVIEQSQHWQAIMKPILAYDEDIYAVLVKHLNYLDKITINDAKCIANLLSQLKPNMAQGCYLRALPVKGVDTKFIEAHQQLITALLDEIYENNISESGGLIPWLDCRSKPKDWLFVKPLCDKTKSDLSGLHLLRLSTDVLLEQALPAERILIVENEQSGFALPELANTIAVFGGGRNVSWTNADWLKSCNVGYWGDIDTWGFVFLSEVRRNLGSIHPLLMDKETVLKHKDNMVHEDNPCSQLPDYLTEEEQTLFCEVRDGYYGATRLEQEKLNSLYIKEKLNEWT